MARTTNAHQLIHEVLREESETKFRVLQHHSARRFEISREQLQQGRFPFQKTMSTKQRVESNESVCTLREACTHALLAYLYFTGVRWNIGMCVCVCVRFAGRRKERCMCMC